MPAGSVRLASGPRRRNCSTFSLLCDIDCVDQDRSAFLEGAARQYLAQFNDAGAAERDARDKMLYELHADELNAEAADVLDFQTLPE